MASARIVDYAMKDRVLEDEAGVKWEVRDDSTEKDV